MKSLFKTTLFILTSLFAISLWAAVPSVSIISTASAPTKPAVSLPQPSEFDLAQANQTLDNLMIKLSVQRLSVKHLQEAVETLVALQSQAKKCVTSSENDLANVTKQLQAFGLDDKALVIMSPDQKYIKEMKAKNESLTQKLSQCKVFVLRSQQAISTLSSKVEELTATELLSAKSAVWKNFASTSLQLNEIINRFNKEAFIDGSGLVYVNQTAIALLVVLILAGVGLGLKLSRLARAQISTFKADTSSSQLKLAFFCIIQSYALSLILALFFVLFTTIIALFSREITYLTAASYALITYLALLATVRFFFYPPEPAQGFSNLPPVVARKLRLRLTLMATLCLAAFFAYTVAQDQDFPLNLTYLARTSFVTLFAINLIGIIWLVSDGLQWFRERRAARLTFSITLSIALSFILLAEWLGYHNLTDYLLFGMAATLGCGFAAWALHRLLLIILHSLRNREHPWQQRLYANLGLKKYDHIPELLYFRIVLDLLIWGGLLIIITKIWGISTADFKILTDSIVNGFTIANIKIIPLRIIFGLFLFGILSILVRMLRYNIKQGSATQRDRGNREALAAIFGYAGFGLAILFCLLIAGVNFAGLAIIAGALSVGIGFGLQNIVSNFVSGIVLLIERPIKPGDRVVVGQTEGTVKKISIRSTRIITDDRADVVVPNSELITGQVTNLMFYDYHWRIKVVVGVAYGSDTELVKKLLLEVALAHPEVLKEEPDLPYVIFRQFAESSLQFELCCIIADVNHKSKVLSELNFAVDKTFREHGIEMPYAQRDINIRNWTDIKPSPNEPA